MLAGGALAAVPELDDKRRGLRAHRAAAPAPLAIDGRLDDAAWRDAPSFEDFHKHAPRDGKPIAAGLRTTVQ